MNACEPKLATMFPAKGEPVTAPSIPSLALPRLFSSWLAIVTAPAAVVRVSVTVTEWASASCSTAATAEVPAMLVQGAEMQRTWLAAIQAPACW